MAGGDCFGAKDKIFFEKSVLSRFEIILFSSNDIA